MPDPNEQWEAVNFVRLLKKIVREAVDEVLVDYRIQKKPIQDLPPVEFASKRVRKPEVVKNDGSGPGGRLTVKEAAKYMGVSVTYIYTRCRSGEIPHLKLGRKYYVYKDDIDQHLEVNMHSITP